MDVAWLEKFCNGGLLCITKGSFQHGLFSSVY